MRAFTYCLDAGGEREEEEWRVHLRIVHFNLTASRSMGGETDFRERQAWRGRIIKFEVPPGYSGDDSNRIEFEEKGLGWSVLRVIM